MIVGVIGLACVLLGAGPGAVRRVPGD